LHHDAAKVLSLLGIVLWRHTTLCYGHTSNAALEKHTGGDEPVPQISSITFSPPKPQEQASKDSAAKRCNMHSAKRWKGMLPSNNTSSTCTSTLSQHSQTLIHPPNTMAAAAGDSGARAHCPLLIRLAEEPGAGMAPECWHLPSVLSMTALQPSMASCLSSQRLLPLCQDAVQVLFCATYGSFQDPAQQHLCSQQLATVFHTAAVNQSHAAFNSEKCRAGYMLYSVQDSSAAVSRASPDNGAEPHALHHPQHYQQHSKNAVVMREVHQHATDRGQGIND
jgi:hypothetical protein